MIKSQDILGLPIICISEGLETGQVKDIIIDSSNFKISHIVIDNGIHLLDAKILSIDNIISIGSDAITIESDDSISSLSKESRVIELLQKNIQIRNLSILTKKGKILGKTGDFFVNEDDSCRITDIECILDSDEAKLIPNSSLITLGKHFVIVEENALNQLRSSPSAANLCEVPVFISPTEPIEIIDSVGVVNVPEQDQGEKNVSNLFKEKQKEYLKDKKATKTILAKNGSIIIDEGEVITEEIIGLAESNDKLIELVMNNKV